MRKLRKIKKQEKKYQEENGRQESLILNHGSTETQNPIINGRNLNTKEEKDGKSIKTQSKITSNRILRSNIDKKRDTMGTNGNKKYKIKVSSKHNQKEIIDITGKRGHESLTLNCKTIKEQNLKLNSKSLEDKNREQKDKEKKEKNRKMGKK